MKCTYCGADIPEEQLVCPRCGREVQIVPDYNPLDEVLTAHVKGALDKTMSLEENRKNERLCREYGCEMILIRENYLEELLEQIGRRFPYDHWLKMRIVEKHQSSE